MQKAIENLRNAAKQHKLYQNILKTNGKIVIGRGQQQNPEYLFIGEAPGQLENRDGKPFVGRSGEVLDMWIKQSKIKSYAVINAVPIIPLDNKDNIRAPTQDEINYFRPYTQELINKSAPKYIICLGKSAAKFLELENSFNVGHWHNNIGFLYHPAWYLRNGNKGLSDFKLLLDNKPCEKQNKFLTEISKIGENVNNVISDFIRRINGTKLSDKEFTIGKQKWLIVNEIWSHSDDIIISENDAKSYDCFLLVKSGSNRVRIPGWTTQKDLLSTPKVDIFRNGSFSYMIKDINLKDLTVFKLLEEGGKQLKKEYIVNQQITENLGHTEMISGILAGLHYFAKQAGVYFKDINQIDEAMIDNKIVKIVVRVSQSDEDILIPNVFFNAHPEIDYYMCCKVKQGNYWYVGYTTRDVVAKTRTVQMMGEGNKAGENIRRIFSSQYLPISNLLPIYASEDTKENITEQNYVPLHVHTEFSVGDGFGTVKYIAENLYKKGFKAAAITDHGTLGGTWEFQKALLEKGLKPIIGCEIYVNVPETDKRLHLVALIKDKTGWLNLLAIQAKAVRDGFYHKPIAQISDVYEHKDGLIFTGACMDGVIHYFVHSNQMDLALKYLVEFKEKFGDDFYGEIQLHEAVAGHQETMQKCYEIYKKNNIKCILSTDSHYPNRDDKKIHDALKSISLRKKYGEAGFGDDCFYLMTDAEMEQRINTHPKLEWMRSIIAELKANTFEIVSKIDFNITPRPEKDTLPKFLPAQSERRELLKALCIEGLSKYTKYSYEGKIKDRLDLEMNRILDKEYENYFLIVWDMIKWAKSNGILVGVGRGSVGASLVAYTLNITEIDPIKYDLLFDRFLSEIRKDMPDADIDYQDDRRHEVFDYLRKKYSDNCCGKIITYARFHPKGVLRDIGRIFGISMPEIEKICNCVIIRLGGDARSSFSLLDTFAEFADAKEFKDKYPEASNIAVALEGHIRHKGIHAAAMIISESNLAEYIPITKVNSEIVTEWEKQLVEDVGLIKFDILGLRTLSMLKKCIEWTNTNLPTEPDDPKVYETIFKDGNTTGIFQFETVGLSKLSKQLQIDNFSTLYDAITLFRPGALHSGQCMTYVNRHLGKEPIKYEHPLLEKITSRTKGIILYQEQIMQIMHDVGGMSWATAEMSRKFITKSKGKKAFENVRKEFVTNANRLHGMDIEEAQSLFDVVSTFGSYSFNLVHAVEYSMISYFCAWYKTYYPSAFYAALLSSEVDSIQISKYISEAKKKNVKIMLPNINISGLKYSIFGNSIYSGLSVVKGLGNKIFEKIVNGRPYKSFNDFCSRCSVNDKVLNGLIVSGAFDCFGINKKECFNRVEKLKDSNNELSLLRFTENINVNEKKIISDFSEEEMINLISKYTELRLGLDNFKNVNFGSYDFTNICDLGNVSNKVVIVRGIVTQVVNKDKLLRSNIKKHVHKFENHIIYLNLNDGTGDLAVQINPHVYTKYRNFIMTLENSPLVVLGLISESKQKIYADLLEIPGYMDDIKKAIKIKESKTIILSSYPAVSKKGSSYYRLIISDGTEGLCFKPPVPLYAGMPVKYLQKEKPFLTVMVD